MRKILYIPTKFAIRMASKRVLVVRRGISILRKKYFPRHRKRLSKLLFSINLFIRFLKKWLRKQKNILDTHTFIRRFRKCRETEIWRKKLTSQDRMCRFMLIALDGTLGCFLMYQWGTITWYCVTNRVLLVSFFLLPLVVLIEETLSNFSWPYLKA